MRHCKRLSRRAAPRLDEQKDQPCRAPTLVFFHSARGSQQRRNPHTHSIPRKHESNSDSTINDINCYYRKTHFQSENPFRESVSASAKSKPPFCELKSYLQVRSASIASPNASSTMCASASLLDQRPHHPPMASAVKPAKSPASCANSKQCASASSYPRGKPRVF